MAEKEQEEPQDPQTWDWERAERRPGRKKARAVVSVAFSRDDFETVARFAERARMRVSEFIRSAALGCAEGNYLVVVPSGGSSEAGSMGYLSNAGASTRAGTELIFNEEYAEPSLTRR